MGFLSRIVVHTVVIGILAFGNAVAFAGQLILKNMSSNPITCTVVSASDIRR